MGAMIYLAVYDICDPKRLRRIAKAMRPYGIRVQKSVFECSLQEQQLSEIQDVIRRIITGDDSVIFYPLRGAANEERIVLGTAAEQPLREKALVFHE
jgi:CRISPR-associated protein Cas2